MPELQDADLEKIARRIAAGLAEQDAAKWQDVRDRIDAHPIFWCRMQGTVGEGQIVVLSRQQILDIWGRLPAESREEPFVRHLLHELAQEELPSGSWFLLLHLQPFERFYLGRFTEAESPALKASLN